MAAAETIEDLAPREIPRRAAKMFGELASTYFAGGWCVVGRIRNAAELAKREPYRSVVVYGRARTFAAAFAIAERHFHAGTPDWLLDATEGSR